MTNVVLIYGAPAVGKLTVAKELTKITKYKLLHNHAIIDLLTPLVGGKVTNEVLWNSFESVKLEIIKAASKKRTNLILTDVYNEPHSKKRFENFIASLKKLKIRPYFVNLVAQRDELYKRVGNQSRKKYGKIKTRKELKQKLSLYNLESAMPFVNNLILDNSKLSPKQSAKKIKEYYRLK